MSALKKMLSVVLLAGMVLGVEAICSADEVDVVVVAPKSLYAGTPATLSVTVLDAESKSPVQAGVRVWFNRSATLSTSVFDSTTDENGRLTAGFDVPAVDPGSYSLDIEVAGAEQPLNAPVIVKEMPLILIETDKPIYKPSQTIHGRALVLTNQLKPSSADVDLEITDAKGVKIFRKTVTSNAFGVAAFDLDLASELNFGTWKISAESGSASGSVDLRVEQYVLPRFEVDCLTERDYFLVDEAVPGTVTAAYFFGKPVGGTVRITASRYEGLWEEYGSYSATLADGQAAFELPAVGYVSGTGGAGGAGSVQLDIVVTDTSGHEEKTTKLLKIVESKVVHQLIDTGRSLTPGRPFDVMLVAERPDGTPAHVSATLVCDYYDWAYGLVGTESPAVADFEGQTVVELKAPERTSYATIHSTVEASDATASAEMTIYASYSPSDSYLHLSRKSSGPVSVGDTVVIDAYRTHESTIFYDVFANGHTVFSEAVVGSQIAFAATPQMVPGAKVVAYIINPNNEISADSMPFEVVLEEPTRLDISFDAEQVLPGDPVRVSIDADVETMVGVSIVDESVYALNEGRLNMQEVFNELESRFMEPQAETHEDNWWGWSTGAYEVFEDMGLQLITNGSVNAPKGWDFWREFIDVAVPGAGGGGGGGSTGGDEGLAEVTRIRQFFPETWLWMPELLTDADGNAWLDLTAPDSITTWRLSATSTSQEGLGMTRSQLLVFQEFFGEPDLPYAVTRGEQFPVRIQVFNYLNEAQTVRVELTDADWFELLEPAVQTVEVPANSVSLASFLIEPRKLGSNTLEVVLQSPLRADAVRKQLLVEPEGTRREIVENGLLKAGESVTVDADVPEFVVEGSARAILSITPSLVAQSINGVEDLLNMPYGCGEQNMIFFAPDVEILRYLDATGQLTPEIRAKAEHFITCGYQRELTYRRADGSFSAFGESDESGSLWLTAFVLGTFSGARDFQTIDASVMAGASSWIEEHQKDDGSWEPVGFVHHKEMLGGAGSGYALTAFVTIALADYGSATPDVLSDAAAYLQANITTVNDDAYALAIAALAFAKVGDDASADAAIARLLEIAISNGDGVHWEPLAVETTAYAALAMIERENSLANQAVKWLSLQQNSLGGYGSTQDTVMALKALMTAARAQSRDVDLTVTATDPDGVVLAQFSVNSENFDVLQMAEIAAAGRVTLTAEGSGETRFQLVRRFNVLLGDDIINNNMALQVEYDASTVEVDDIVTVTATVRYLAMEGSTGMMIVDVGVPTGFATVAESLEALIESKAVSRVEVAGRKVIFYVDELTAGEQRVLVFQVKARFPVRAIIPDSAAYSYYSPDIRAEAAGTAIEVAAPCRVDLPYIRGFSEQWLTDNPAFDYDDSGEVDFVDFALLSELWLEKCPQ